MTKQTATTATAVASGVQYVKSVESSAVALYNFGAELAKVLEGSKNRDGLKLAIATEVSDKTGRTVHTIQNKIGEALKAYKGYANAKAFASWTLDEKKKKAVKAKARRSSKATKAIQSTFVQLTDAEVNDLIARRDAFKKASK
jgi:hypothetical protein